MIQIDIDFSPGSKGLQAQLAEQGVFPLPESVDILAVAEGDRAAISRLFCHGYISDGNARSLLARTAVALLRYPFDFSSAKNVPSRGEG